MRYVLGFFIFVCLATACLPVPDYDSELNPFTEEFDGSFVDVTGIENGYDDRNGLLSYRVFFKLNERLVPKDAQRVEIHVDGRPEDHFFIQIRDSIDRVRELSFYDQKVELGKTHTYRFHLGYKKYLSQPSNPGLAVAITEP